MNQFFNLLLNYESNNTSKTLEEYLDITSNEILFDDVLLCRLYDWKIKELAQESGEKVDDTLLAMILYEVIWRMLQKGGKPVDITGKFQPIIDSYGEFVINQQLAMEMALFQINNPGYGSDWGGIWLDSTRSLADWENQPAQPVQLP